MTWICGGDVWLLSNTRAAASPALTTFACFLPPSAPCRRWQCKAMAIMGVGVVLERSGLLRGMANQQAGSLAQQVSSLWLSVSIHATAAWVAVICLVRSRVTGSGHSPPPADQPDRPYTV